MLLKNYYCFICSTILREKKFYGAFCYSKNKKIKNKKNV